MVAPSIGRLRSWGGLLAAGGMAIGVAACVTAQSSEDASRTDNVLSEVRVDSADDETVVTLVGLHDPTYTAFLNGTPPAVVLDMASVDVQAPDDIVMVYDGLVENVALSVFSGAAGDPLTRVEVALARDADYEVDAGEEGLVLHVRPEEGSGAVADRPEEAGEEAFAAAPTGDEGGFEESPLAASEELPDTEGDPWASAAAEPIAEPVAAFQAPDPPAATRLVDVDVSRPGEDVLVHLHADGVIHAVESFGLENPTRLVVDLPGLQSEVARQRFEVGAPRVASVRLGAHPDKVRVVIDGGEKADGFASRQLSPAPDGLFVAIGAGEELEQELARRIDAAREAWARAAAPPVGEPLYDGLTAEGETPAAPSSEEESDAFASAPGEEPGASEIDDDSLAGAPSGDSAWEAMSDAGAQPAASDGEAVEVFGVQYDVQPDRDRVAVLSEQVVDYVVHEPDEETVVLSLEQATISKQAEGRISPAADGPLSLITAFQQPDVETPEVRVVMKRAPGIEPQVTRRGTVIFVDFPRDGVAARPPLFQGLSEMDAGTGLAQAGAEPASGSALASDPASLEALESVEPDAEPGTSFADEGSVSGGMPAVEGDLATIAPSAESAAPASLEPPASVEILEEGGLIDGKEYQGRRISLDFKDVEIADVLRLIAEVSDLNLIAGDEVQGKVTIRLVDVPWDQALDVILLTKGLGFVRVGNVLRIAPSEVLKAEEEVRLQERRNKEKLEDLEVKLQPVNYASVKEVSELVKRLLSARGTVNTDERTNTLIIKDIASVVDEAVALVKAIDTQTPQVMIEAKIVEANLDFSRELGSLWGVQANKYQDAFDPQDLRRDLGGEDFLFIPNQLTETNGVSFANPTTAIDTFLGSLGALILDEKIRIDVVLEAAEENGEGKVISSPRVVTLDNRQAKIEQGVSIPFQTFENGDAKLEFVDAVLSLEVTPHITSDGSIIMALEVTRNAPDDTVSTPTGSPAIAKNVAETETLVKDGQTLVIGGIYTITKTERQTRVPYLHRLPVLGNAFKSKEVTDSRKELLIFVTPRVVVTTG
jgi:type IV pilus secretin PilQ/predicted competence protein